MYLNEAQKSALDGSDKHLDGKLTILRAQEC